MKRILIVEDEQDIGFIMKKILENDFIVDLMQTGEAIMKKELTFLPHLFIVDRQLPGKDGFEICRFIKQDEEYAHIPVILMSANPDMVLDAGQVGADDTMVKPFDIEEMFSKVERLLKMN